MGSCGFVRPLSLAQWASRVKGNWATKKLQLSRNSHEENFCGASVGFSLRPRPAYNLNYERTERSDYEQSNSGAKDRQAGISWGEGSERAVHWRARRTRPRVEGSASPSSSGSVVRTPRPRSQAAPVRHLGLHGAYVPRAARPTAHVPGSLPRRGCHRATAPRLACPSLGKAATASVRLACSVPFGFSGLAHLAGTPRLGCVSLTARCTAARGGRRVTAGLTGSRQVFGFSLACASGSIDGRMGIRDDVDLHFVPLGAYVPLLRAPILRAPNRAQTRWLDDPI